MAVVGDERPDGGAAQQRGLRQRGENREDERGEHRVARALRDRGDGVVDDAARARVERLQRFTSRLAPALTIDSVSEIAIDKALVASGGITALLGLPSEDGRHIRLIVGGDHPSVSSGRTGIKLHFADEGPGIADVNQALTDGWSSGTGLGLGLSGSRRLVDEFELKSEPGAGTSVVVVKWSR